MSKFHFISRIRSVALALALLGSLGLASTASAQQPNTRNGRHPRSAQVNRHGRRQRNRGNRIRNQRRRDASASGGRLTPGGQRRLSREQPVNAGQ